MTPTTISNPGAAHIAGDQAGFSADFPANVYNPLTGAYSVPRPAKALFQGVEEAQAAGLLGQGLRVAIIDTGLMLSHPWIQRQLVDSVDFTGEGPDDLNGHGTAVAFALIYNAPASALVNVKCFNQSGGGSQADLIRGLKWCVGKGIRFINLSGGVCNPACHGDCELCQAALEVGKSGPLILAAAGNDPDCPLCPGKAAARSNDILAVGAYDTDQGQVASYSAVGEVYGDVGKWQYVEVRQPQPDSPAPVHTEVPQMTSGPTPDPSAKEQQLLDQQKAAEQARQAIAEAQQKAAEALKLKQAAQAQSDQLVAEAQQKIAEADKARRAAEAQTNQAVAEASQKIAEAERATLLAKLPKSDAKGLEGITEADDKSGYVATIAAYEAMQRSAAEIAADINAVLKPAENISVLIVSDLIVAPGDLVRLQLNQTMTFMQELLAAQLDRNKQATAKAEKKAGEESRTAGFLPALAAAPTILQSLVSSAAELAGYFQSNFSIKGQVIDLNRDALVNALADGIKDLKPRIFYFHLIESAPTITMFSGLLRQKQVLIASQQALIAKAIDPLTKRLESATALVKTLKSKPEAPPIDKGPSHEAEAPQATKLEEAEAQLNDFSAVLHDAQSAGKETASLIEALDAFVKNVTLPANPTDFSLLTQAALHDWIHAQHISHLLWLKPVSSGGDAVTKRQLFQSGHVSYVGGGVITYVLAEMNGTIVRSGTKHALSQISRVLSTNRNFRLKQVTLTPAKMNMLERLAEWLRI